MILLVDDDSFVRMNLEEYLKDEGIEVHSFPSGEEALAWVNRGNQPEAAIIDIRLSGMDGTAVIEGILSQYPDVRIIIHTGSAGFSLPEMLKERGVRADHILLKPILDMQVLVDKLGIQQYPCSKKKHMGFLENHPMETRRSALMRSHMRES
jgi:two-component system, OmpR family, response regulator